MYYQGNGISRDYKTAFDLFNQAAEQGYAPAQFRLAAEQEDNESQFKMGLMYDHGFNVEQDYSAALAWYRLAADHGHVMAQNNLGSIFREGRGVPRDDQTAIKWYRQAANQRLAEAQYNLGSMYITLQEPIRAHMWWNIAASNGYKDAVSKLDMIEREMTPEDIVRSRKLARICLAKDYQYCD
jgi:TPR repeat protein